MTTVWLTVGLLAVGNVVFRAAGPLALGGRTLPPRAVAVISLLAPALLAALVVYETFSAGATGIAFDGRAAGLAAAAVGVLARLPMLAVVAMAAVAAAIVHALG